MRQQIQQQPSFHVKARSDGFFVVFDKDQRLRFKANSRDEVNQWIAEHVPQKGNKHAIAQGS